MKKINKSIKLDKKDLEIQDLKNQISMLKDICKVLLWTQDENNTYLNQIIKK